MTADFDDDTVPDKISVRLDEQTREQILTVMRSSGMTCSQSVRLLIVLGAAREEKIDMTFKAAASREVALRACARIRARMEGTLTAVLKDLETEAQT